MLNLSDFRPCSIKVSKIRKSFNDSYIKSILYLLEVSSEVLNPELYENIQKKISSLNPDKLYNGFLYYYNSELIEAIENNNINKVNDLFLMLHKQNTETENFFLNFSKLSPYHQNIFKKIAAYEYHTDPKFVLTLEESFNQATLDINKSFQIIRNNLPELFQEINLLLGNILLFTASAPKAGSSFDFFGTIYLNLTIERNNIIDVIDSIVHETAHLYLYLICCEDPLTLNLPEERYEAPFRKDKRPISGIYHAAFVLTRLIYTMNYLIKSISLSLNEKIYAEKLLNSYIQRFFASLSILKMHGNFTELGKNILKSCEEFALNSNNSN